MCFHETPISELSGAVFLGMAASMLAQFRQSGLHPGKRGIGKVEFQVTDYATNQELAAEDEIFLAGETLSSADLSAN